MFQVKNFCYALALVIVELAKNVLYPFKILFILIDVFTEKLEYTRNGFCRKGINLEKEIKIYVINTCWWLFVFALGSILWKINLILD